MKQLVVTIFAALILHGSLSLADGLKLETVALPALRINGQAARAHTQGLEIAAGKYYVTARREDVRPRRALLLRTEPAGTNWDVWDITSVDAAGKVMALDHPGGMQSDGKRLWIPVAESKRHGRSRICVFALEGMVAGKPLKPVFEFSVNDHIGALAVESGHGLVFGANWDTETVYVWDLEGRLKRTLTGAELKARDLGVVTSGEVRAGVAVQDWKVVGDRLFASGLFRAPESVKVSPKSRWISFANFLETDFQRRICFPPLQDGVELAREAMAVFDGLVYFLPEDLGARNRLFRVALADLLKRGVAKEARASQNQGRISR
ncbi:MAG: hypothetical protein HY298_17260 [Verrucomicrobia bacterium]|nr:hypothetical protein [Verrucomicrobiota bacterium]